jgi:hypothetical protein
MSALMAAPLPSGPTSMRPSSPPASPSAWSSQRCWELIFRGRPVENGSLHLSDPQMWLEDVNPGGSCIADCNSTKGMGRKTRRRTPLRRTTQEFTITIDNRSSH